jgi:hypothetical protein
MVCCSCQFFVAAIVVSAVICHFSHMAHLSSFLYYKKQDWNKTENPFSPYPRALY